MATTIEQDPEQNGAGGVDGEWKVDRQDREYVNAIGRRGIIYRHDNETVAEALARDQAPAAPGDKRPRKSRKPKTPPPSREADLRELEAMLAEAFKSPAMPCAMFGDEWAANHFTTHGPYLARNLILASEHNPWLRRKLEAAASGGDMMMQIVALAGVSSAVALYIVPPLVWWLNLPMPEKGREMFGIPDRREHEPSYAPAAQAA